MNPIGITNRLINIIKFIIPLIVNFILYAKISHNTFSIINVCAQFRAKAPIILLIPVKSTVINAWKAPLNPKTYAQSNKNCSTVRLIFLLLAATYMPIKEKLDGSGSYHSHEFLGVDVDLTKDIEESSEEYQSVKTLLQNTLELEFGGSTDSDIIRVENNNTLIIPITITSLTGHSFPSGTSFSREAWLETIVTNIDGNSVLFSSIAVNPKFDISPATIEDKSNSPCSSRRI